MKQRILEFCVALAITNAIMAGILLDSIAKQPQQVIEIQPTVTPTPTPDLERIELIQENDKLRQEVINLQIFKSDFEGLVEAQIRR